MLPAEAMCARGCVGGGGCGKGVGGRKERGVRARPGQPAWGTPAQHWGLKTCWQVQLGACPGTFCHRRRRAPRSRWLSSATLPKSTYAMRPSRSAKMLPTGRQWAARRWAARRPAGSLRGSLCSLQPTALCPKLCQKAVPLWGSKHKNGGPRLTRMRVPVEQAKLEQLAQAGDDAGSDEGLQIKTTGLDALHISAPAGAGASGTGGGCTCNGRSPPRATTGAGLPCEPPWRPACQHDGSSSNWLVPVLCCRLPRA